MLKNVGTLLIILVGLVGYGSGFLCGPGVCEVGRYCCNKNVCLDRPSGSCFRVTTTHKAMAIGLLVGIFAGVPAFILGVCGVICYFCRWRAARREAAQQSRETTISSIQLSTLRHYSDEPPLYEDLHQTYSLSTPPPVYEDACRIKEEVSKKS